HRAPSDPATMSLGPLLPEGSVNSVTDDRMAASEPALGLMRPIWLLLNWVNHRLPSGPCVMFNGPLVAPTVNSVTTPVDGTTRATLPLLNSANQKLPSGANVMPLGWLPAVGTAKSLKLMAGTQRGSSSWTTGRNILSRRAGRRRSLLNRRRSE